MIPPLQWDEFFLKDWSWLGGGLFQGYVQFEMKCDLVQYEKKVETTEGIHSLNLMGENSLERVLKILEGPLANKCNMRWNVNLKE
jgi:hypothetical protein